MKSHVARMLAERYLKEGGAYGHMMHLYDNWDLTFGELKQVLAAAASGRLEKAVEKTDGMNLVFTWDSSSGQVKAARSVGDIRKGGMDAAGLSARFSDRPGNVVDAFTTAFRVLSDALGSLSEEVRLEVFGEGGATWYSMEVIYPASPNVINYDKNYIVFHAMTSFTVGDDGKVTKRTDDEGFELLRQHIDTMQRALSQRSWHVAAQQLARLQALGDGSALSAAVRAIDAAMGSAGVDDSGTLGDYMKAMVTEEVADLGLGEQAASAVVARVLGAPGAPTLTQIRKLVPPESFQGVSDFVKSEKGVMAALVRPIEMAVHRFSVELLRGMQSVMVGSHDAEVARLRAEVARATQAVEASGDAKAMEVLRTQLSKLQGLDDIASSAEGVVFQYKGNAYKFTGAFAPVNQILGLLKYGRGGSKVRADEGYLREVVGRIRRGPGQRVRMRLGELRALLEGTMTEAYSVAGLQPWPEDSLSIPEISEEDRAGKVGPFERRLAAVLGGKVVGGGTESRDIVVGDTSYEVKKPDKANEVRLGGEGMLAFAEARGQIEAACRQIDDAFGQGATAATADASGDVMSPEDVAAAVSFARKDIPEILKGNLSVSRMKAFYAVLVSVSNAVQRPEEEDDDMVLMMGDNERSIERDIDVKTYMRVGKLLQVPPDELGVTGSDVLATVFTHEAFRDPEAFMRANWTNAVKASSAMSQVDAVAFVTARGYRLVGKDEVDDVLAFNRLANGRLNFRIVA